MFNTITKTKYKTFKESASHNFEESNLKVNRNANGLTSALVKNSYFQPIVNFGIFQQLSLLISHFKQKGGEIA